MDRARPDSLPEAEEHHVSTRTYAYSANQVGSLSCFPRPNGFRRPGPTDRGSDLSAAGPSLERSGAAADLVSSLRHLHAGRRLVSTRSAQHAAERRGRPCRPCATHQPLGSSAQWRRPTQLRSVTRRARGRPEGALRLRLATSPLRACFPKFLPRRTLGGPAAIRSPAAQHGANPPLRLAPSLLLPLPVPGLARRAPSATFAVDRRPESEGTGRRPCTGALAPTFPCSRRGAVSR